MMKKPAGPLTPIKHGVTLREIHTITKTEVWQNAAWVNLESSP